MATDQKPPDSSFPFGVFLRAGYDNRDLGGFGWTLNSQVTYGTAILRVIDLSTRQMGDDQL